MNGNGHEDLTTGNPLVDAALKRLNGKFKDLEDALVVQAHLEKRQSEQIRQHGEFLIEMQEGMRYHKLQMKEFDEKLNALIMWWMKREGLPEAGSGEASK